jgi:8-oxo-dGTP diphosphatase
MQPALQLSHHLSSVSPWDAREAQDLSQALLWVENTPKGHHFIVYNVLVNQDVSAFLLVHHRATGLWLPCGGHIESNESPLHAAVRELHEELGITQEPIDHTAFFVSMSPGENDSLHVCLWFVFLVPQHLTLVIHRDELLAAKWFARDQIPLHNSDPQLARFLNKFDAKSGSLRHAV